MHVYTYIFGWSILNVFKDGRKEENDIRKTTYNAGAGVVPVMVSYPGTPCTEVSN